MLHLSIRPRALIESNFFRYYFRHLFPLIVQCKEEFTTLPPVNVVSAGFAEEKALVFQQFEPLI